MAEFCEACSIELGHPYGDFRGITSYEDWDNGKAALVICEGCGPIQVNPAGFCVSNDCLKAGQEGHGR